MTSKSEAGRLGQLVTAEIQRKKKAGRIAAYELAPTRCQTCNLPLPFSKRSNKFCNHTCAARTTNLGVRRHPLGTKKCIACDKILTRSSARHFCNNECRNL